MLTALLSLTLTAAPTPAFAPKNRPYDALHYTLDVRLDADGSYRNRLTAKLKPSRALTEVEFDAYDLKIELVMVNGKAATPTPKYDPATKTGVVIIKAPGALPAGKEATVEIAYSGKAGSSHEGFFSVDPDGGKSSPWFFTHFEPFYAQRFFPCNDQPADKATFDVNVVVDEKYTVLSNGRKERDEKFAEDGKNLRRVTWKQEKPHSTYLTALAVGQFEPVEASSDIPSTVWVRPGTKDKAFVAVDSLKPLYNTLVGFTGTKYPWAKLDVVTLPRFYWGGMENTSLLFERESRLVLDDKNDQVSRLTVVSLLAHEMAHQWFGNLVTNAWWDEVWLNEGFANYLGAIAADEINDSEYLEVRRAESLAEFYFRQEDGPRARPLVSKASLSPEGAFDAVAYIKGASVLRMLERWVGRPELKKVFKAYLEKHALGTATSGDFFKQVFDVTKKEKELKAFKESWLTKKGYPVLFTETSYGDNKLTVKIRQQPNRSDEKGPFVFKLPIVIHRELEPSFTKEETILVDKPEVTVTIDTPAAPQWINWNADLGALVRLNPASISEEQWVEAARHDPDPTWRLQATWALLGELANPELKEEVRPTETAMGAILDVLNKDPSPYVRVAVMNRLLKTRFKKLPADFSAPVLALAKRPTDLNEDPIGYILVRRTAMELLGRTGSSDGHAYLLEEIAKSKIDINFIEGFAAGVARIGTTNALATLRAAAGTQRANGFPAFRRTAEALGSFAGPEVVPVLRDLMKNNPFNNELGRAIFDRADHNTALKQTNDYANFVKDVVLDEATQGIELRDSLLATLQDVKTDAAKEALMAVSDGSPSARLKASAKRLLDANFPIAPVAPPAKGKPAKK